MLQAALAPEAEPLSGMPEANPSPSGNDSIPIVRATQTLTAYSVANFTAPVQRQVIVDAEACVDVLRVLDRMQQMQFSFLDLAAFSGCQTGKYKLCICPLHGSLRQYAASEDCAVAWQQSMQANSRDCALLGRTDTLLMHLWCSLGSSELRPTAQSWWWFLESQQAPTHLLQC